MRSSTWDIVLIYYFKAFSKADGSDLVSYRGPRSMVTVNISVDVSTEYRSIVSRVVGECRSSISCYIGDVSTDHWITFGREFDRRSVAIASAVCRQYTGEPLVKYWSSICRCIG